MFLHPRRHPRTVSRLGGLLGLLLALAGPAQAVTPAQHQQLERALADHAQGHFRPAREAFEQLARAGVPAAHHNLAVMHLQRELPGARTAVALRHLQAAADAGFVTSQVALAEFHESGRYAPIDLPRAMAWYQRAAESGSVDAQVAIGTGYYLGRGVPRDEARALQWYRQAAQAGDVGAQYLLASMYETGLGTEADLRLARYWYDVAARQGDEAASGKRDEVSRRLAAPSL
ncbi:tetratricopeptide repeat protein [Sphaerotilus montanus]|jgi:TPR repeat protein|uniref:tetratricopeptide repeat protein n=1 Tax=Sphaerotilus montanus TaxID=522889 RepID=UPI003239BFF0